MEKLVEKISRYHIFNYLVPGYLFLIISGYILKINLINNNILYSFFEAYFIGIVISRISSLVIENILNKIFRIKKEPYEKFIEASLIDKKITILSQDSNMYRCLCTLAIMELMLELATLLKITSIVSRDGLIITVLTLFIITFAFSYKKQNKYILKRVKKANVKQEKQQDTQ
mgnify:FL=1